MITKEVLKNIYDDWCGAYGQNSQESQRTLVVG